MSRPAIAPMLAESLPTAPEFTKQLEQAAVTPGLRKGERTRRLLRAATARALERERFAALTVEHIADEAKISRAAVYQYAASKEAAVKDVLHEFHALTRSIPSLAPRGTSVFETILQTNRYYIDYYSKNAIFMERIYEARDFYPELIVGRQELNAAWAKRIVNHARRHGPSTSSPGKLRLRALMLECMIDDVLREVFVIGNPSFRADGAGLDEIAFELSTIWYRSLYGKSVEADPAA